MIKYLLFDLDSTLYPSRYGIETNVRGHIKDLVASVLGIKTEDAWQARQELGKNYATAIEWLMEEKGLEVDAIEDHLAKAYSEDDEKDIPPDPQLKQFLESIPIPKAILTNATKEHALRVLDKLDIRNHFTHIFDVRSFGYRGKPNPYVYTTALDILGMKVDEVVYVDDNPRYAAGFISIGGKGVLLDELDHHADYPHPKIRELKELKKFLDD